MEQTHCREPDNPCSVRECYQLQAKDSQVSQYKLHYRQTLPSPKGSALFLTILWNTSSYSWRYSNPSMPAGTELRWTYWKRSPKSKHITAVCSATGCTAKWGACSTPDYLYSRERPSITKAYVKSAKQVYSRLLQFKQSEHTYIWTWSKAEVPLYCEVFKTLAHFVSLMSSSAPQQYRFAESFSQSLSMTNRRLMLEKFNSHNIKNDDKISKYRETEPDQHTATTTLLQNTRVLPECLLKQTDLGALEQSPATHSLKSYITHTPAKPEWEVRYITGLLTSYKDAHCKWLCILLFHLVQSCIFTYAQPTLHRTGCSS